MFLSNSLSSENDDPRGVFKEKVYIAAIIKEMLVYIIYIIG
jgi:hypothetical protein